MKTLSNNFNGKVVKTSGAGYSVQNTWKRIEKFLLANGFTIEDFERAGTGSIYFCAYKNDQDFDFRVSNHTKRFSVYPENAVKVKNETGFRGHKYTTYNFDITSTSSYNEVTSYISANL